MSRKPINPSVENFSALRKEAEKLISVNSRQPGVIYSKNEKDYLSHELQVYQIELEMQNDQLRLTNEELEIQRAKFAGLYDLAPIGYFILNEYGIIKDVNNTGCAMLDTQKSRLIGKNFLNFIKEDDGEVFVNFLESIQLYETRESCRLTLIKPGKGFYTQVEGVAPAQDDPEKIRCYLAVIDITERNNAEINQKKEILAATINSQENERKRISETLHDSVGQLLYGIKLKLDQNDVSSGVYKELHQLLDQAIMETRDISFELAPSILKDFGLAVTLNEMAKRLRTKNLSIEVSTDLKGRFELNIEVAIFRIIQELVNNSIKHAAASRITISVKHENDNIAIEVADNGKGFEDHNTLTGTGLAAIRSRLSLHSGQMNIETKPGKGSRVQATLAAGYA